MVGKKKALMGEHTPTRKNFDALRWCFKNKITIGITASTNGMKPQSWWLDITNNNMKNRSPEAYGPGEIWIKLHEYYAYYYNKHNI
jgi:hypothetical protein|tara:strand:+ start:358 stop:615 length:258 start_codon:yes stop_codon:yes gene_type:complete